MGSVMELVRGRENVRGKGRVRVKRKGPMRVEIF